ncbi:unnamed protein product [Alternaria alternata]|jgi:uncharacterized membrane protein YoaK (UPF0700 family)|uniref:DUF1275 domain protein n=4 Tax=Alternaria sect. Alternaria TaxID=2499237 RepID=A0A177DD36_ALTAL|nr:hypothetical protein CC77DRAFT_1052419 [Alternaria alternata]XP_028507416.1 hypothetical protein AA0111_g4960 [Alternaria arborescens]XP_051593625.1 uncharacterized protein J4E82_000120 [Alternaria postmessia]KAB2104668.1 hypothetical protein AG0111_0g6842 [Alternaria gaisen]RII24333.1 hypothetical protein CUC08_Gglean011338 [Alternaria sp. MG1]RYN31656.1 hypothetical protein AA0115_g4264 [Alternaria tenuissima]KAH6846538.1 hypothetical protein B0T12DRAFT_226909 [Alternaria alternata]KAH8
MSSRNATRSSADEETPLLGRNGSTGGKSDNMGTVQRFKRHMNCDVTKNWADLVLLFCYIITGLLDSSAVFIWGSFVSMQTGNTVYLGLGVVAPSEGIRWIKALTSITAFCAGSFCFARFHRYFSPAKRWVLIVSYSFQMLLIAVAALIATVGKDTKEGLHWQMLVPLASVAFQSSGQAVTSRALKYNGLTSVVLTSNYCDLFSDPQLFKLSNVERNRRIGAPAMLLLGACIGGLYAHSSVGLAGALWTACGLKLLAVFAWVFWPSEILEE